MLGLMRKDILVCKRYLKTMALLVLVFAVFSFSSDDNTYMLFMIATFFMMMTITSFAYDQVAKWDPYSMTMPVTRSEVVLSKYLVSGVFLLTGSILSTLLFVGFLLYKGQPVTGELAVGELAVFGTGLVVISILIPFIYKFGVEKARLIMVGVVVLPSVLIMFFTGGNISAQPSEQLVTLLVTLSPFAVIACVVASYLISVGIFTNKEL